MIVLQVETLTEQSKSMEDGHKATLIGLKREQNEVLQRMGKLESALNRC